MKMSVEVQTHGIGQFPVVVMLKSWSTTSICSLKVKEKEKEKERRKSGNIFFLEK